MSCKYALALDAGGSFFKACIVSDKGIILPDSAYKVSIDSNGSAESILDAYRQVVARTLKFMTEKGLVLYGMGISTPGPFDYKGHTSLMTHKFKEIYGIDLRNEIAKRCGLPGSFPISFIHDGHAFLQGEHFTGAAKGYETAAGVTLGTGLGFGLWKDGHILDNGAGAPYISIYNMPWKNGILEDLVSKRGILAYYREISHDSSNLDVIDLERMARAEGNAFALRTFREIGSVLGQALKPITEEMCIQCIVCGGQISNAFPLFEKQLRTALTGADCLQKIAAAQHIDTSALIGAASAVMSIPNA